MIGGDQPISEVISDIDLAFDVGILIGFIVGIALGIMITHFYYDWKNTKGVIKNG